MKLYHFCAMRQGVAGGTLSYADGMIQSAANFGNAEEYAAIKRDISELMDIKSKGTSDVVLLSLTRIGEVTPNVKVTGASDEA